jgi:hypothetical protein
MGTMSREAVEEILTVEDLEAILGDKSALSDVNCILEARNGPDKNIGELIISLCEILYDNEPTDCDDWDAARIEATEGPISLSALKFVRKDSLFANAILKILREHDYHDDNDEAPSSAQYVNHGM